MKAGQQWITVGIAAFSALTAGDLKAQDDSLSAVAGLQLMEQRFGPQSIDRIVEMHGMDGQPQPGSWELVVYDPNSPHLLRSFVITGLRTIDKGDYLDLYPDYTPAGFASRRSVAIDSTAAFRILDGLARKVGVGFDRIDYYLRCKEFTAEPIWRVTALDVDGYPVGHVYLSASTGEVYRTVWFFWGPGHQGAPRIVDSALTGEIEGSRDPLDGASPGYTPGPDDRSLPGPPQTGERTGRFFDSPADRSLLRENMTPPDGERGPDSPSGTTVLPPAAPTPRPPANPNAPAPPPIPPDLDAPRSGPADSNPNRRIIDNPEGDPVEVERLPPESQNGGE